MKNRAIAVALTGVLALGIVGCGGGQQAETTEATPTTTTEEASATTQQQSGISWNEVASADAAAKGAGFSDFVVLKSLSVAGQELADPMFAYADGVAQAIYEKGPVVLIVRKADGKRNAPLTDRETAALNSKWFKSYDGVDVTLYGPKQGDALVLTWSNGQEEYGVTVESNEGEDVYLTTGEVASIVSGLAGANPTKESDSDSTSSDTTSNAEADAIAAQEGYISSEEAKQCALNSYGDSTGVKNVKVELKNDADYPHYNVTFVASGMQYLFEVDAYTGGIWSIEESEATASSTSDDGSSSGAASTSSSSSTGGTSATTGAVTSSSSTESSSTGGTTNGTDATNTGVYTESATASEASE